MADGSRAREDARRSSRVAGVRRAASRRRGTERDTALAGRARRSHWPPRSGRALGLSRRCSRGRRCEGMPPCRVAVTSISVNLSPPPPARRGCRDAHPESWAVLRARERPASHGGCQRDVRSRVRGSAARPHASPATWRPVTLPWGEQQRVIAPGAVRIDLGSPTSAAGAGRRGAVRRRGGHRGSLRRRSSRRRRGTSRVGLR